MNSNNEIIYIDHGKNTEGHYWPKSDSYEGGYLPATEIGQNFIRVANHLEAFVKKAEKGRFGKPYVDMNEPEVKHDDCGTTSCFAGWYMLSILDKDDIELCDDNEKYIYTHEMFEFGLEAKGEAVYYRDGADQLALSLGFEEKAKLESWCWCYPSLWGNKFGEEIFVKKYAFSREDRMINRLTIWDICEWLRNVGQRCIDKQRELEAGEKS